MSKGIVVIGATFVDIKGYPEGKYVPAGRMAGKVCQVKGGVSRHEEGGGTNNCECICLLKRRKA